MPTRPNPLGPNPVYNTSTIACDMGGLYDYGVGVISLANLVVGNLDAIITTLNGLKEAGAWLGPSADDAQALFETFNSAAKELFNDAPPGLLASIGINLQRAAVNYDAAEDAIASMFDAFMTGGGSEAPPAEDADPGNPVVVNSPQAR